MLKSSDDIYVLVFLGMCGTFLLSGAIVLFYVRYQRKFYLQQARMKDTEMQYQVQILQSTIQMQEDERRRIGRDLHDEVGGTLARLGVAISGIAGATGPQTLKQMVENCQALTDDLMNNVRHISHNLSPSGLGLFGFSEVLAELCERTAKASGLPVNLKNDTGKISDDLDVKTSIALYRVVQELLTNTLKHAGAGSVTIIVSYSDGNLILDYADDGKGLDEQVIRNKGIGMFNIESRLSMVNATFTIGGPGIKGFNMHIVIPISNSPVVNV